MSDKAVLKGNAMGGFLDNLINKGQLPEVRIDIGTDTFIQLGIMLVVSMAIVILLNYALKQLFLN